MLAKYRKFQSWIPILLSLCLLVACPSQTSPSFTLRLSSTTVSVAQGQRKTITITVVKKDGFDGQVTLKSQELPKGVTEEFLPNPSKTTSSWLLIVAADADIKTTTITLTGVSAKLSASTTLKLTITQAALLDPPSFEVDSGLKPVYPEIPGINDGDPARPTASLSDGKGQADFVENEVILMTDKITKLNAFLQRWQGKILMEIHPQASGLNDLKPIYLIRINAGAADPKGLVEDIRTLDPKSRGNHQVSSEAGLRLLTAAAQEAAKGTEVGINWLGLGSQFRDRISNEAPTGPKNFPYTPNAFTWEQFRIDGIQDIGVAEAWRTLEMADRLKNKVKIAILDSGFAPNNDFPANWQNIGSKVNVVSEMKCTGGATCNWHGTGVLSAAMGVAANNYGAAGPAGPVAEAIFMHGKYSIANGISAILAAKKAGARIINMSWSARIPAVVSFTVLPLNVVTASVRASGTLLFSAAGNYGANVDAEDCFIFCWEEAWHMPCENDGVICVGGIAYQSVNRASGSNYGPEEVDIFAPYTLFVGPNPDKSGNYAQAVNGTSVSSPFTAGVAALIWAAKPSLSANQVETILYHSAHTSPDAKVNRYVDAFEAVHEALGDLPPEIAITAPKDGTSFKLSEAIVFTANATDAEDGTPTVNWSSSVDGALGTGVQVWLKAGKLSVGQHTITATATDTGGYSVSDKIDIGIANNLPTVTINRPQGTENIYIGQAFTMRGSSHDPDEPGGKLPCNKLTWTSSVAGDPMPVSGCEVIVTFNSLGSRTITLTGKDSQGATATDSQAISVIPAPSNSPPIVNITSPNHNDVFGPDDVLSLAGTATDPDGDSPLAYTWYAHKTGDPFGIKIGTGTSMSWKPSDTFSFGSEVNVTIALILIVRDPHNNQGSDIIGIRVIRIN